MSSAKTKLTRIKPHKTVATSGCKRIECTVKGSVGRAVDPPSLGFTVPLLASMFPSNHPRDKKIAVT